MREEAWIYDFSATMGSFLGSNSITVRTVIKNHLSHGAHPFFLEQTLGSAMRLAKGFGYSHIPTSELTAQEETGRRVLAKEHRNARVPVVSGQDRKPASRLYDENGQPRLHLGEGVFHGVVVETFNALWDEILKGNLKGEAGMVRIAEDFQKILEHPHAPSRLQYNVTGTTILLFTVIGGDLSGERENPVWMVTSDFWRRLLKRNGLERTVQELVSSWSDGQSHVFWQTMKGLIGVRIHDVIDADQAPVAAMVRALLILSQGKKSTTSQAARQILSFYPISSPDDAIGNEPRFLAMQFAVGVLDALKAELPNVRAFHAFIRLLQNIPAHQRHVYIAWAAVEQIDKAKLWQIDPRSEFLLEDILGADAWKALCDIQENPTACGVTVTQEVLCGVEARLSGDMSSPVYRKFYDAVQRIPLREHNGKQAEELDEYITTSGASQHAAEAVREDVANLLSGDILVAVTHLRVEWMPVTRTKDDFLGVVFPKISVAQHPKLGDRGVACKFRIEVPELPSKTITGTLDADGISTIDGIRILSPRGRALLEAAVAQTVAAVLIPRYVEEFTRKSRGGGGIEFAGEVRAMRPVIHTLGDLQTQGKVEPPWGMKINPAVAQLLFLWLTGQAPDYPFQLFRRVDQSDGAGNGKDHYFATWRAAKNKLSDRSTCLADVYFRTVRAYSRPVAVFKDGNGDIVVQQMSDRARRNYERYRQEGGRDLDFSHVRKTYVLPDGRRILLDVPRTFNRGTFHSLHQAWESIPDPALKRSAKELFSIK